MENAEYLDYDVNYPVILLRGDRITKLIVRHYYEKRRHISGMNWHRNIGSLEAERTHLNVKVNVIIVDEESKSGKSN